METGFCFCSFRPGNAGVLAGSPFGNVEGAELTQEQRQFAWLLAISFCNAEYKPARRRRSQESMVILQLQIFQSSIAGGEAAL
jgi:hypothetical protein